MSDTGKAGPPLDPDVQVNDPPTRGKHQAPRSVIVIVLLVIAAALGGGARRVQRHVTEDASFCLSCHTQSGSALGRHAHAKQRCASCHKTDTLPLVTLWLGIGNAKNVAHGQTLFGRCKSCHFEEQKTSTTARSVGHLSHLTGKTQLTCDKCHVLKDHDAQPNASACVACHAKVKVHEDGMTDVPCLSCHQFQKLGQVGDKFATGCPSCHSGAASDPKQAFVATRTKPITTEVVHGNVNACRLCHVPHASDAERRRGEDCAACHSRIVGATQAAAIKGHLVCSQCHQVHGQRPKTPELCVGCHASATSNRAGTKLFGKHQGCIGCHAAHQFKPSAAQCIQCHASQQGELAAWKSDRHANCLSCHSGHSGKDPASACVGCHQAQHGHGHESCTTCHAPHQSKASVKVCVTCHQPVAITLASLPIPQHQNCSNCHASHAAPLASRRCATCHARQAAAAERAAIPAHQLCKSCHAPHQFSATANSCNTCHHASDLGVHRSNCTKCHERHGPPGRPKLDCVACHTGIRPSLGHHSDCTSCHAAHRQPQGGPNCVACHRSQVAAVNLWRPKTHQQCNSCHERHSEKPVKACADCHTSPLSEQLGAGHRCQGCHDPHQSPVRGAALCNHCHAAQAAAVSGAGTTHSDCIKCHRPHSAALPTCQSCHTARAGAHAIKAHQRCADCHASHRTTPRGRENCLICHKKMVNHFPKAAICTACHAFK